MKLAPWTALAAIALFVAVAASARKPPMDAQVVALDFTGIDRLEVSGADVYVHFSNEALPHALLGAGAFREKSDNPRVVATRDGRTLRVVLHDVRNDTTSIVAPLGVRELVLDGGGLEAEARVPELAVRTRGDVSWKGEAGSLRIVEFAPDAKVCHEYGWIDIKIAESDVATLHIGTRDGRVDLSGNANLGPTTLALGPFGKFTLEGAKRVPPLTFVELPPGPCAEELAKRKD